MTIRHRYLVAYDIAEPSRLRAVFKTMKGYGYWTQLSVFICDLSKSQRIEMEGDLLDIINEWEDRVMIVRIGNADDDGPFEFLGQSAPMPLAGPRII